jgi:hypothetical protein
MRNGIWSVVMTELELLNLARSTTGNEVSWFAQMISINFAMVVAIYYFLHKATVRLKVFSFVAYTIGTLVFLGEMLIESNVKNATLTALRALPSASISLPTRQLLGVSEGWLGVSTAIVFNSSFWILWLGVSYLLFFGRRFIARP